MKSERRHELQHNILADWLAESAQSLKPYQNIVLLVAAMLVILVGVYAWWSHESAKVNTRGWEALNTALETGDPAALTKVIEDLPGTTAADMAAAVLADEYLARGCQQLFVDKASAQQELTKAVERYVSVRAHSQLPWLLEKATFGLARAKEAKGDAADIEQARQFYKEVTATWPDGAYTAAAGQRLADLDRPATKEFYDRFAHFDPKPVFSSEPSGRLPFDAGSMPKESPLSFPSTPSDLKPDDTGKDQGKPDEKEPAGGAKPSDEKNPAEASPPAEEKKAVEGSGK